MSNALQSELHAKAFACAVAYPPSNIIHIGCKVATTSNTPFISERKIDYKYKDYVCL